MKKKFWNKKLQLNKETVSKLNFSEMKKIAGGFRTTMVELGETGTTEIDETETIITSQATICQTCETWNCGSDV